MTDLLFRQTPLVNPADLIFGEVDVLADIDVNVVAPFPLGVNVTIGPAYDLNVSVAFPALAVVVSANYDVAVDRPVVATARSPFESAAAAQGGVQARHQDAMPVPAGAQAGWLKATNVESDGAFLFRGALPAHGPEQKSRYEAAIRVPGGDSTFTFQNGLHDRRLALRSIYQDGIPRRSGMATDWQDRYRDRRPSLSSMWGQGRAVEAGRSTRYGHGAPLQRGWASSWRPAIRPPAGTLAPLPPYDPCYIPSTELVYWEPYSTSTNLVFWCERHDTRPPWELGGDASVVVPIRSVYVVINNVTLKRAADGLVLPTYGMSMSIDADSWTWSFSASLWASVLDDVMPSSEPVEVEATINGLAYRFLIESVSRDRSFGSAAIRVSGRGLGAVLASPYSPVLTFANNAQRTAQQLMADVLLNNGIPMGWAIDWHLNDWLVPAGVFNVRGSRMDGLLAVASAAGGYLQPHPTAKQFSVLHRYPVAPWNWDTVTPDFELPADVAVREGIEWISKPAYDRVFVSGTSAGVIGQVTITGSGGLTPAPMVTDALITEAAAARQRGVAVLGDTGRQAKVSLNLPVLPETGIIMPGKFVRYNEGASHRLGIVRSTSVDVSFPNVFQSLTVETHL